MGEGLKTNTKNLFFFFLLLLCSLQTLLAAGATANISLLIHGHANFFCFSYASLARSTSSMAFQDSCLSTPCSWPKLGAPIAPPHHEKGFVSPVSNSIKHQLLNAINGSRTLDQLHSHTGIGVLDIIASSSVSYPRVITGPNSKNWKNTTDFSIVVYEKIFPYAAYFKHLSKKHGPKKDMMHNKFVIHEAEAFDEAFVYAMAANNQSNCSESIYQFSTSSDSMESNTKSNMRLTAWKLLCFTIIHLSFLVVMKLLTRIFEWIFKNKENSNFQEVRLLSICVKLILILMLLVATVLVTNYTVILASMRTVEKLQPSIKEFKVELAEFRNRAGIPHSWSSKENKDKNNSAMSSDSHRIAKDRKSAQVSRIENNYMKPVINFSIKYVFRRFSRLNVNFNGNRFIVTRSSADVLKWVMGATFPYGVSGEFFTYDDHEDVEEYYDKHTYELHQNENTSVTVEELEHVVEYKRTKVISRNEMTNMKLRILVPKENAFHEFVKIDHDHEWNQTIVTGYSVELFKEVINSLPYKVLLELIPYENGRTDSIVYYDELIHELYLNRCEGIVGDLSITANRSKYGDFTQPYMMSGVSMIVPIEDNNYSSSLWWFLKPLNLNLWLTIIAFFLSKGILIRIFEHGNNAEFEGTVSDQVVKILCFSFSIFSFAQMDKVKSNCSKLVVIFWMLAVFVLMTAYAAMLQSMLTCDNVRPSITNIEQLIANGDYVGYQKGSFVLQLLKNMGFQEQKLRPYVSKEDYAKALSRGSDNNGVSAIIDEVPYIMAFLAIYGHWYTMAGRTYRSSGGFGFMFRRGFPMLAEISRAVLQFTESEKISELENEWFGHEKLNYYPLPTPGTKKGLTLYSFRGIFLITEPVTGVALLIFVVILVICKWRRTKHLPSCNDPLETSNNQSVIRDIGSGQATTNDSPSDAGATLETSNSRQVENSCCVEMSRYLINENDQVEGDDESDRATINDRCLEAGDSQDGSSSPVI